MSDVSPEQGMELVCPAGNLPSLKAAIDNGADAVYIGFQDETNARQFPGLNFTDETAGRGAAYAHAHQARVFVAINTYPQPQGLQRWRSAVDRAASIGADALIVADMGVMKYAARQHPKIALHLSVQASATSHVALKFYHEQFGIRRAVLPRVLSLSQVCRIAQRSPVAIEVFGFGSLCIMAEGRCHLSSYLTGDSPNVNGVCSPAWAVRWEQTPQSLEARLSGVLIDRYDQNERAAYPTLCKGRFRVGDHRFHALEEPTSLNTLELLPDLQVAGVQAIKIEGRQRSPGYVGQVAQVWRRALDRVRADPQAYVAQAEWMQTLARHAEGSQTTLGAYHRRWQ